MKTFLLGFLLFAAVASKAQETYRLQIGVTSSHVKHLEADLPDGLGYFVGAGTSKPINEIAKIDADVIFLNQSTTVSENKFSINSVNAGFGFRIYPLKKGLFTVLGMRMGLIVSSKSEGESFDYETANAMAFAGAGYEVNRIELFGKFNYVISDGLFQNMIQIGAAYRISK